MLIGGDDVIWIYKFKEESWADYNKIVHPDFGNSIVSNHDGSVIYIGTKMNIFINDNRELFETGEHQISCMSICGNELLIIDNEKLMLFKNNKWKEILNIKNAISCCLSN